MGKAYDGRRFQIADQARNDKHGGGESIIMRVVPTRRTLDETGEHCRLVVPTLVVEGAIISAAACSGAVPLQALVGALFGWYMMVERRQGERLIS